MGFESTLSAAVSGSSFGKERYALSYKERAHLSRSKLDMHAEAVYIGTLETAAVKSSVLGPRYIAAMNLTYDLLLAIYDVNTSTLFAARLFGFTAKSSNVIDSFIRSSGKRPNFEARLIGMQSNESIDAIRSATTFLKARKLPIVDVDLFGNEIRHIALDSKIGVPYNILNENRIYRPGELVNNATLEQFEHGLMKTP